jgi:hypothetical protein
VASTVKIFASDAVHPYSGAGKSAGTCFTSTFFELPISMVISFGIEILVTTGSSFFHNSISAILQKNS